VGEADAHAALLPILGRSPLQRHAVQLARAGVERCVLLLGEGEDTEEIEADCRRQLSEAPTNEMEVRVVRSGAGDPPAAPEEQGPALRVWGAGVYDPRLYRLVVEASAPMWIGDRGGSNEKADAELEPIGMAATGTDDEDSTERPGRSVAVGDLPAYLPGLRRHLRPYWCRIESRDDMGRAGDMILDATQKGVLDFPARFLHPPLEDSMVRLLAPTPITPNQITVFTGVIGFAAAGMMAVGVYGPALVIALVVNVLDGVDGKLARVKLLTSRFGDRLDHTLDVLFEFAWYLGLGWGLSGGSASGRPFLLGLGLIGVMLGARGMSGIYKLVSGRQIHDHRAFDRAVRLFAGRRNIYVVILVVGLAVGRISEAFTLCFVWAVATLGIYTVRTAVEGVVQIAHSGTEAHAE